MKKKCLFLTAFIPLSATSPWCMSQVYITIHKHTQCFAFQSYITWQLVSSVLTIQKPYVLIRLEISPFYNNNALKIYIKSIRALSNYNRPKDI